MGLRVFLSPSSILIRTSIYKCKEKELSAQGVFREAHLPPVSVHDLIERARESAA